MQKAKKKKRKKETNSQIRYHVLFATIIILTEVLYIC